MKDDDFNRDELVDLESRLRRVLLSESATGGANRILARVQGHVREHPLGAPRDWQRLMLTVGAVAVPALAAAAIAAILVFGNHPNATRIIQPAGSPPPTSSASPSPKAPETVIVETSSPASLVGPQTVHWLTAGGTEFATHQLAGNEAALGAGGSHMLIYRSDGHVLDLHPDGSSDDVGAGMPASGATGQTSIPVRALVSPDGTQWIWGQIATQSGSSISSTITVAGIGAAPRVVARATENNHALQPYRWVLANPLISHSAVGVGGYYLFDYAFGPVDQLDLATGKETLVGPPSTSGAAGHQAVDLASNGAAAYTQNQGTTGFVVVNGPGQRGLSATVPASNQTGGLMFDAAANHLVFATSPSKGAGGVTKEQFETDIIDLNSGAKRPFGPADLRPAMWLTDGRLVEFRTSSDGDGVPGTFLVSLDGSAVKISAYDRVVGVIDISVP